MFAPPTTRCPLFTILLPPFTIFTLFRAATLMSARNIQCLYTWSVEKEAVGFSCAGRFENFNHFVRSHSKTEYKYSILSLISEIKPATFQFSSFYPSLENHSFPNSHFHALIIKQCFDKQGTNALPKTHKRWKLRPLEFARNLQVARTNKSRTDKSRRWTR